MSDTRDRGQVPADSTTARVAEILLSFAGADRPLGITDLARSTHLSKAVVHRIVQTLRATGFLSQVPDTRKYQVGPASFTLAGTANQASHFRRRGLEVLANLAEVTGETTTLSSRIGHRRIYIAQVESRRLVRISVEVGVAHPLTIGASSSAILAFLPEGEIESTLAHAAGDGLSDEDHRALRDRLETVRRHGYARTTGERVRDATSFAAPVADRLDDVVGAISIAALTSRLTPDREEKLAAAVVDAAATLSTRLKAPAHD